MQDRSIHAELRAVNHYLIAFLRRYRRHTVRSPRLPAIPAGTGQIQVILLTTPQYWRESLWSAYSWLYFLPNSRLELVVDGDIKPSNRAEFELLFPGGTLSSPRPLLREISSPELSTIYSNHRYGRKIHLLIGKNQDSTILYSDFDVLCLKRPLELIEAMRSKGPPRHLLEQSYEHTDPWISCRVKALDIRIPPYFNSGVMVLPKGALEPSLASEILKGWTPKVDHLLAEQSLFAAMLGARGSIALPPETYVTSWQGMIAWQRDPTDLHTVVLRHYCGVVRHRFYRQLPDLERQFCGGGA